MFNMTNEILENPYNIKHFPDAPLKIQVLAVTLVPASIYEIKDPCEKVQIAAVNLCGTSIQHIAVPTARVKELAYTRIDEELVEVYQSD